MGPRCRPNHRWHHRRSYLCRHLRESTSSSLTQNYRNRKLMKYLLALDQGTTSSRALVIDYSGEVIAVSQKEFAQFFPQPGWVDHDANKIWASHFVVAPDPRGRADISPKDIAAI